MEAFGERRLNAVIWFLKKRDPNMVVYITDANGIVRYDSRGGTSARIIRNGMMSS